MGLSWSLLTALTIIVDTLPNGLQLIGWIRPNAPYAVASLWVRSGSALDPIGKEGTAHLVEHLLPLHPFEGTTVQIAMERQGVLLTPETGRDFMALHLQAASASTLLQAAPLLLVLLHDLAVPEAVVEREKALIRQELLASCEDPLWLTKTWVEARLFQGTRYEHPPGGWLPCIEQLTFTDARHWFQQHFRPENAALIAVMPDEKTLFALADLLRKWRAAQGPAIAPSALFDDLAKHDWWRSFFQRTLNRHEEALWGLGWRLPIAAQEQVAADGLVVYLRQVLAPSVFRPLASVQEWNFVSNPVRGSTALTVVARLRPIMDEPERRWRSALRRLADQGLNEGEMQKVRWLLRWQYQRTLADPLQCVRHLGWAWALHDAPSLVAQKDQELQALTSHHLQELAKRLIASVPVSVLVSLRDLGNFAKP